MKVLVTGGAGFIGSHTVDLLLMKGYQIRIIDSLEPPVHPQRVKPAYVPAEAEFILGDVRCPEDMASALQGVDYVIHLAAYQDYLTDFSKFAFVNDGGTALLYELVVNKEFPIRKIIVASSQAVYGEGKYECLEHGVQYPESRSLEQLKQGDWDLRCPTCLSMLRPIPTDEERVNPHNQYAVSKYCQELYALTLGKRYGIPTVVMRYSITQGPRQSFYNAYSGVLRIFATRLLNNQPPVTYEDGQQMRDYVYVGDVAHANVLVLENDATAYRVFNVGGGQAHTVLEYAHLLANILKKDIEPQVPREFRFGDTRHIISEISELRTLGWEPTNRLEQIAIRYVEWLREQPEVRDYYSQAEQVMKQAGAIRVAQ